VSNVQVAVGLWWEAETETAVGDGFVLLEYLWVVQLLLNEAGLDVVYFVPELVLFDSPGLRVRFVCRAPLNIRAKL
jgi:hypothetical protein